jgi:sugar phosphate permease
MTASWQLALLWGVVVGLGTGTMAAVLGAMVANRWFTERRGVVLGLLTASSATGQLLFLPLLASMVVRFGWRSAVLLVAGVALVVLPLVALLMRDHPRDIGLRPFGEPPNAPPTPRPPRAAAAAPLIGLALGLRSRDFWLLAGSFFICGLSTNGLIGTHLIPASMEHGIPEVMAASLLASIGLLDIIGTTVSGWLSDRWDNRYLLCWYYGLRGLSLLFLPYAFGSAYLGLAAFVIFYGLDWVATVPPTARLAADTFGRENVGIMFGWIAASHQLGAATAAYGGGLLHTWLGDYQVTFMSAGLVCLIAAGLVLRIGQASRPLPTRVVEAAGA